MVIDFIPVLQYTYYYNIVILFLVLLAFWQCASGNIFKQNVVEFNAGWGFILSLFIIFYMGLRPVSAVFGDTVNYARGFKEMTSIPFRWEWGGEWLFYNVEHWFARNSNINMFFLLCSTLYVLPIWIAMHRMFGRYSYVPFLVFLGMFSFWTYGVNGIRNGIGASLIILAMTYVENIPIMTMLCVLATGFHSSVFIMIAVGALAWFIKNSYYYLIGWLFCIVISYFVGDAVQSYLAGLGIGGDDVRFSGYLTYTEEQMINDGFVVSMTFRWDFIAFSALGVGVGYYFIFVRKFQDEYYHWIYNTYLALNAFWILIIRAAYSNRFAQISWFILPVVLIYPFMKQRFWLNHEKMLGYALMLFYAYTFFENFVR